MHRCLANAPANFALAEHHPIEQRIAQYRVVDPVRRLERTYLGDSIEATRGKIYHQPRQSDVARRGRQQQCLLEAICLGLHTVDKNADNLLPIDAAPLEDMPRCCVAAFARVGGRKNLVAATARRLQGPPPPKCGSGPDGVIELFQAQHAVPPCGPS